MNRIKNNRILLFILILSPAFLCQAQNSHSSPQIEKTTHDFGTIQEANGNLACTFQFANDGTSNLIIQDIIAECGCTTLEWSNEPIQLRRKIMI
jgi:hypothetical protein